MKTFQEFLEEGKKKRIVKLSKKIGEKVKQSVEQQRKENPDKTPVADYGNSPANSDERKAAIVAMMAHNKEYVSKLKRNDTSKNI